MIPYSIRWRLPLSYAVIALLATLSLSAMLIATLQLYFRQNEAIYLYQNARALSERVAPLMTDEMQAGAWQSQINGFSFLLQARVRILDRQREVVVDSGLPDPLYMDLIVPSANLFQTEDNEPYMVVRRQPVPLGLQGQGQASAPPILDVPLPELPGPGNEAAEPPPPPPPPPPAPLPTTNLLLGFVLGPEATRSGARSDQSATTPIIDPQTEQTLGFVELSAGPAYGRELVQRAALVIVLASVIATAGAAVVGWFVSRRMTTPLLALTRATASMAAGDLTVRADVGRNDEIGSLARSFNTMAQRIEEVVKTLRRFVSDAAHELNTPLTALRSHVELALDGASPEEQAEFLQQARADADRLEGLANDLLDLSRVEAGPASSQTTLVDVGKVLHGLEDLYMSAAEQKNVQLTIQISDAHVEILGEEGYVRRALTNVLDNALKYTPEGGRINVQMQVAANDVLVQVQDTGIGIPATDLPHVFSRFHRARNTAAYPGSGLGLAIVQAIMQRHQGAVSVESDGGGTTFTFRWPRADLQPAIASVQDMDAAL